MVEIDTKICLVCGGCIDLCPKTAIKMVDDRVFTIPEKCVEMHDLCEVCPVGAPQYTKEAAPELIS